MHEDLTKLPEELVLHLRKRFRGLSDREIMEKAMKIEMKLGPIDVRYEDLSLCEEPLEVEV